MKEAKGGVMVEGTVAIASSSGGVRMVMVVGY